MTNEMKDALKLKGRIEMALQDLHGGKLNTLSAETINTPEIVMRLALLDYLLSCTLIEITNYIKQLQKDTKHD